MHPAGLESIPTGKRPQAHALDRAANGIGINYIFIFTEKTVMILDLERTYCYSGVENNGKSF